MLARMKLYNYFRSSASFRVRIALQLKGLPYEYIAVHLAKGEHKLPAYSEVAADNLVPNLVIDGEHLSQSMAIIEYLDEVHPEPALLPKEALARARVRALAQSIACEIHPINNLRVLKYLSGTLGLSEDQKIRGTGIGFERDSRLSKGNWRRAHNQCTALATRPAWPIAAWCHKFSMHSDLK